MALIAGPRTSRVEVQDLVNSRSVAASCGQLGLPCGFCGQPLLLHLHKWVPQNCCLAELKKYPSPRHGKAKGILYHPTARRKLRRYARSTMPALRPHTAPSSCTPHRPAEPLGTRLPTQRHRHSPRPLFVPNLPIWPYMHWRSESCFVLQVELSSPPLPRPQLE
jgi:hypothetical protein